MRLKKLGMMGIVGLMIVAMFLPLAGASNSQPNIWSKISIEKGSTQALGGGNYVALKTNNSMISIIYGSQEYPNSVKIVAEMERYAGGVNIYNESGSLVGKRILRYRAFMGQGFNYIGEVRNINNSRTLVKYVSLKGAWHMTNFEIINVSANETKIDFTIYMKNVPYTKVYDNTTVGDGVVNEIALHFHITAQIQKKEIRGFPWYSYSPANGLKLQERKDYKGEVVTFQIKYDKEIDGWDYSNKTSKLVVANNIFWGVSGNDKVIHLIMKRYGASRAQVDHHIFDNRTLPHHRILFRHSGRIIFTEVGEWQRIGRFRWESNVTVDNVTRQAYYQIVGGERIVRWFNHHTFALTVLNGMLIYPVGSSIFQDPSLEVNQFYINFEKAILPTMDISMIGLVALTVIVVGLIAYRIKK